ncbi:MAG: hypothetical protein A3C15_00715 [Candidatus Magasanikbacteria bacterium RIFCSPHIGHO2_02_FULL_50_9b]|uniref:Fido domain-containing protein n=1 Tax=Candidatus Magasanikbacteria bacterium RIFCSPHIGHO2_02_FULL_50_9b TaxID=1798682 RepID=A0A1F6M8B5_9BACT|nr:MAG: hypothetical protein A3C15_00715 [Candidatus Magasanikbacteria bacterium RIFCSPHIGHO2_02_FULL_50_9b]
MQKQNQEIVLYGEPNGAGKVEVLLKNETLWLNLMQLATLFGRDKSVISRHLRNIYIDGELDERATVAKFATVQKEGSREIEREIEYYNLDAIISVGYRVNSKLGTRFRIWATTVLRDHIMKGYSINESRLKETTARAHELERAVRLIRAAADGRQLKSGEARGLLTVITEYAHSWSLLQQFDEEQIKLQRTRTTNFKTIAYDEACAAIVELKRHVLHKKEAGSLFGAERERGLERVLGAITQTFGGKPLYPSLEERAAHLLYFVIKDHPFSDGNKRIGAFMFVRFLEINAFGRDKKGERKINANALVALALLIAASKPVEKEIMIALVTNLLQ